MLAVRSLCEMVPLGLAVPPRSRWVDGHDGDPRGGSLRPPATHRCQRGSGDGSGRRATGCRREHVQSSAGGGTGGAWCGDRRGGVPSRTGPARSPGCGRTGQCPGTGAGHHVRTALHGPHRSGAGSRSRAAGDRALNRPKTVRRKVPTHSSAADRAVARGDLLAVWRALGTRRIAGVSGR